jgi:hypothetical protein
MFYEQFFMNFVLYELCICEIIVHFMSVLRKRLRY